MSYTPSQAGWQKITKTCADFSAAGLTNDIEILSLPAKSILHAVVVQHTASFTGGTIATYTISVGVTGNLVKYLAVSNVLQAPGNTVVFPAASVTPLSPSPEDMGASISIRASAISTVGLLNAATTGSVDFYLLTSTLP